MCSSISLEATCKKILVDTLSSLPCGKVRRRAAYHLVRADNVELLEHAPYALGDSSLSSTRRACEPEVQIDGLQRKRTEHEPRKHGGKREAVSSGQSDATLASISPGQNQDAPSEVRKAFKHGNQ